MFSPCQKGTLTVFKQTLIPIIIHCKHTNQRYFFFFLSMSLVCMSIILRHVPFSLSVHPSLLSSFFFVVYLLSTAWSSSLLAFFLSLYLPLHLSVVLCCRPLCVRRHERQRSSLSTSTITSIHHPSMII